MPENPTVSYCKTLALVLESAVDTTLSAYLEQELWTQIGMENDALWSLDSYNDDGMEKAFACLNASPIDLAKLGRLYLKGGTWEGKEIIQKSFVEEATRRDISEGSRWDYQYNFGVGAEAYGSFFAVGVFGQLVYVFPEREIIFVRIVKAQNHYNPPFVYYTVNQIIDQL